MGEETKEEILDPITSLAIELENLKTEVKSTRDAIAERDKQMALVLNANKRLVAELSASKMSPNSSTKIDSGQVAYESFKKTLVRKE